RSRDRTACAVQVDVLAELPRVYLTYSRNYSVGLVFPLRIDVSESDDRRRLTMEPSRPRENVR
ncbi:MAG TPA: hypothetical protein VMS01_18805, partial [Stellaceae bacterium]|nr:hypothetical protein [Stellaceae bacterium]